jgi:integrase
LPQQGGDAGWLARRSQRLGDLLNAGGPCCRLPCFLSSPLSPKQTDTPKTSQREVPLTPRLARLLAEPENAPKEAHVAVSAGGRPWGQYGLDQAFNRVRDRAGLAGWSVYSLRHYAITSWLRRGIPVHVVQKMAGHTNLSTTQRYVHFLKADLEDAARRLAGVGNLLETPPSEAGGGDERAA